jgi:hypothetical protein
MADAKHRVAIIGCGRMGQYYAHLYAQMDNTEIVAIAEYNDDRRAAVGERFGVKALYKDVSSLLKEDVPDIAAIITPTKFYKEAVIACAEAGVKGLSTDKPIAAKLSDADEMVETCRKRGTIYSGGNLQRAVPETQEIAKRIRAGEYGKLKGVIVHGFSGEISGGCCQTIAVLTLLTDSLVDEVIGWGSPPEAMAKESDPGLTINGRFHLGCGLDCPVIGQTEYRAGLTLWSDDTLIEWFWGAPKIYKGFDAKGARIEIDPKYGIAPYDERDDGEKYLRNSINHLIAAVESGKESDLAVSGDNLRHALEVAIASKTSAALGNVPLKLPLEDRSGILYPTDYRWGGGDSTGNVQTVEEVLEFDATK